MKAILSIFILIGIQLLPLAAISAPAPPPVSTVEDVVRVIDFIANIMFTILMVVATIFVILAGFNYLFAYGDATKVQKAHSMLIYAGVAFALGLLAQGMQAIVASVLKGK